MLPGGWHVGEGAGPSQRRALSRGHRLPAVCAPQDPEMVLRDKTQRIARSHPPDRPAHLEPLQPAVLTVFCVSLLDGRDSIEDPSIVDRTQQLQIFRMSPDQ